ncbi:MAG: hypothetical protein Q9227_004638 [Pyrenula ochraceoflavens]
MQSILQYRHFRRHLERQIEKYGVANATGPDARETRNPVLELETGGSRDDLEDNRHPSRHVQEKPDDFEKTHTDSVHHPSTSETSSDAARSQDDSLHGAPTRTSTRTRLGRALTGINIRTKSTTDERPSVGKVFIVGFQNEKDTLNPHNWSNIKRWFCILLVSQIGFVVGLASSIDSIVVQQARMTFGVSEVVESLATGLYLAGFGFGSFTSGPVSEAVGRSPVYIVTMALYMIFIMASGLAPTIGAQLVFRLLAGYFAATPLTTAGGSVSDLFDSEERTYAFPIFAFAAFAGPVLGPVVGGWIGQTHVLSWRWTEWITLIWSGAVLTLVVLFLPETYSPILLKWKAAHLRRLSSDDRYRAEVELRELTLVRRLAQAIYRPFIMFAQESIIDLITLYLTVIYVLLFGFLSGYEFIYTDTFGLDIGLVGTAFLGILIGFMLSMLLVPVIYRRYMRKLKAARAEQNGIQTLPPEQRLVFSMIGAPLIPISLFWMAWTNYKSIGPWSDLVSSVFFGCGILNIFISSYQYLIDSFERFAASALVGATFVRYTAAGGAVVFSIPMYENLGVHWSLTLLGCISLLMMPIPYVFYRYGPAIRKRSRRAAT